MTLTGKHVLALASFATAKVKIVLGATGQMSSIGVFIQTEHYHTAKKIKASIHLLL